MVLLLIAGFLRTSDARGAFGDESGNAFLWPGVPGFLFVWIAMSSITYGAARRPLNYIYGFAAALAIAGAYFLVSSLLL